MNFGKWQYCYVVSIYGGFHSGPHAASRLLVAKNAVILGFTPHYLKGTWELPVQVWMSIPKQVRNTQNF
jgi:hypothetical protein